MVFLVTRAERTNTIENDVADSAAPVVVDGAANADRTAKPHALVTREGAGKLNTSGRLLPGRCVVDGATLYNVRSLV